MVTTILIIGLFIIGAAFGSFCVATVWRLRVVDVQAEKEQGSKLSAEDKQLLKRFEQKSKRNRKIFSSHDRSTCLHCGTQLRWYDLIPVLSWTALGGKCRYCHKAIGKAELAAEISLGLAFAGSFAFWPLGLETAAQVTLFVIWLIVLILLAIHFVYDAKWYLLPRIITLLFFVAAIAYAGVFYFGILGSPGALLNNYLVQIGLSLLILPVFYGVLYVVSKEQWIGRGDVELLIPMAIMVASWPASLLLVFLANLIGCIVVLPGLLSKKLGRMSRIPFGPFLIAAFFITIIWGSQIIGVYMDYFLFKP